MKKGEKYVKLKKKGEQKNMPTKREKVKKKKIQITITNMRQIKLVHYFEYEIE